MDGAGTDQIWQAIAAITGIGTLLVWLFYAQLLFASFRRQRRPKIIINQGWGRQLDSVCLVSNMSAEPIYIECILMTVATDEREYRYEVTDFDETEDPATQPASQLTRQGPLQSGHFVNLGTFRNLIRQVSRRAGLLEHGREGVQTLPIRACEICVISVYGPEDGMVGARRRFVMDGEDSTTNVLRPATIETERLTSRRARKTLLSWLREQL